jgi:hypothetical protein
MITSFKNIEEEIEYLKEQREYWKNKYPVSGLISGLVRMTKLQMIENRLKELE